MMTATLFTNPVLWVVVAVIVAILIASTSIGIFLRRNPKRLDIAKYQERWQQEVQQLCRSKETWPLAIINADKILDEVLKKCNYRGKTMGERLVAAQRDLSENDSAWFGHKLRNKVVHEEMAQLKRQDVEAALRGIRQGLKDLGAL